MLVVCQALRVPMLALHKQHPLQATGFDRFKEHRNVYAPLGLIETSLAHFVCNRIIIKQSLFDRELIR